MDRKIILWLAPTLAGMKFRPFPLICSICVLEYNPEKNVFDRVHMETYGKSGCRRIVPGQYLACDPKGRAIMIGANVAHFLFLVSFGVNVIRTHFSRC